MIQEMIDREDAVNLFHQLLQPNSRFRIIRLLGDAKTGKSHLLTKVFPIVAQQQYGYKYAILDLRNRAQNIIEFLHMICGLLGDNSGFPDYYAYYQQWVSRPAIEIQRIQTVFSTVKINNLTIPDEIRMVVLEMTRAFIKDICRLHHEPLLLLFDSVNEATDDLQSWLLDTLLVLLSKVEHLRIVVSGRVLPDPSGTYITLCQSHKLTPVTTPEAYIAYCQKVNVELPEQSIRDFAKVFDYKPGLFVEWVLPKFVRGSISHV